MLSEKDCKLPRDKYRIIIKSLAGFPSLKNTMGVCGPWGPVPAGEIWLDPSLSKLTFERVKPLILIRNHELVHALFFDQKRDYFDDDQVHLESIARTPLHHLNQGEARLKRLLTNGGAWLPTEPNGLSKIRKRIKNIIKLNRT
jgi:hypothetical protein